MNGEYNSKEVGDYWKGMMERVKLGDQVAFKEIYNTWRGPITAFCLKYAGNHAFYLRPVIEDNVQNVLLRVWDKADKYNSKYNFTTWIYKIAKNEIISDGILKSSELIKNTFSINKKGGSTFDFATDDRIEEGIISRDSVNYINNKARECLGEKTYQCFSMLNIFEMSASEISEELNISEASVHVGNYNAKRILRKRLRKEYPEYCE